MRSTVNACATIAVVLGSSSAARAGDPTVELSGATGFGVLAAGVTSGRVAISPSASVSVRGERGFFVSTQPLLGARVTKVAQ